MVISSSRANFGTAIFDVTRTFHLCQRIQLRFYQFVDQFKYVTCYDGRTGRIYLYATIGLSLDQIRVG
jgi:hypothetical protein